MSNMDLKNAKCVKAVNKLANLYLQSYHTFTWLRDLFQQDEHLKILEAEYTSKVVGLKRFSQQVLDFLFYSNVPFVLEDSSKRFEINTSEAMALLKDISICLKEAISISKEERDLNLHSFLKSLLQENSDEPEKNLTQESGEDSTRKSGGNESVLKITEEPIPPFDCQEIGVKKVKTRNKGVATVSSKRRSRGTQVSDGCAKTMIAKKSLQPGQDCKVNIILDNSEEEVANITLLVKNTLKKSQTLG